MQGVISRGPQGRTCEGWDGVGFWKPGSFLSRLSEDLDLGGMGS